MSQYFAKSYESFGGDINVKVNLSKYATGIDKSNLALTSNLAKLKTEVDKIDVAKLKTVAVDLSKLSNVVMQKYVILILVDLVLKKLNTIYKNQIQKIKLVMETKNT